MGQSMFVHIHIRWKDLFWVLVMAPAVVSGGIKLDANGFNFVQVTTSTDILE